MLNVYLLAMHTLICVTFSLSPGVGGWLRLLLVALPDSSVYLLDIYLPQIFLISGIMNDEYDRYVALGLEVGDPFPYNVHV